MNSTKRVQDTFLFQHGYCFSACRMKKLFSISHLMVSHLSPRTSTTHVRVTTKPSPPPPPSHTRAKICRASLVSYYYNTVILAASSPHSPSVPHNGWPRRLPLCAARGLSVRRSTTPVFHTYSNRKPTPAEPWEEYQESPPCSRHFFPFFLFSFCLLLCFLPSPTPVFYTKLAILLLWV